MDIIFFDPTQLQAQGGMFVAVLSPPSLEVVTKEIQTPR